MTGLASQAVFNRCTVWAVIGPLSAVPRRCEPSMEGRGGHIGYQVRGSVVGLGCSLGLNQLEGLVGSVFRCIEHKEVLLHCTNVLTSHGILLITQSPGLLLYDILWRQR